MQKVWTATELEYAFLFTLRKVNSISLEGFKAFFNKTRDSSQSQLCCCL